MAKTNYTKVEEAFNDGLRKIEVDKLLDLADENAKVNKSNSSKENLKLQPKSELLDQKKLIINLKFELKTLINLQGKDIFQRLGIEKETLEILKREKNFSDEELNQLRSLKEKISSFNEELNKSAPKDEEKTIEKQRKDQKTKRFNINKNWIPLR